MVTSNMDNQAEKNGKVGYNLNLLVLKKPKSTVGSDSSDEDKEGQIRVGREYQAVPPPFIPPSERRRSDSPDRALLVWAPGDEEEDSKVEKYIKEARDTYGYTIEQALGMLFWHQHKIQTATMDLANFTPFPDEWTTEDKVMFEQAFKFHGKYFRRIRQMMPAKSIGSLVNYYYSWKKTRVRTSSIDKQVKQLAIMREEEGLYGEENCYVEEYKEFEKKECSNCHIICDTTLSGFPAGELCGTCHKFWSKSGEMKPIPEGRKLPPKGMNLRYEDVNVLALGSPAEKEEMMMELDREITSHKRVVQNNKQLLSALRRRSKCDVSKYKVDQPSVVSARWTEQELLLGVQGIKMCGKDFDNIASILGTKTAEQVAIFFDNYRQKFNLDAAYNEWLDQQCPVIN